MYCIEIEKKQAVYLGKWKEKTNADFFLYKESNMCMIYNICNRCITCNIGIYKT